MLCAVLQAIAHLLGTPDRLNQLAHMHGNLDNLLTSASSMAVVTMFRIPLHTCSFFHASCMQVHLDSLLLQLVALAESDSSRARRVAAYEGLHSIALWLVGSMAQTSQQRECDEQT
jgi:hypothetical protein